MDPGHQEPSNDPAAERAKQRIPDFVVVLIIIEFASFVIAVAMALGGRRPNTPSIASYFVEEPTLLAEVAIGFAVTNVLLSTLGLGAYVMFRAGRRGSGPRRR